MDTPIMDMTPAERAAWLELKLARQEAAAALTRSVLLSTRLKEALPLELREAYSEYCDSETTLATAEMRQTRLGLRRALPAHVATIDAAFAQDEDEPLPPDEGEHVTIEVDADKAELAQSIAEYPLPVLQWFANVIDGYTAAADRVAGSELADVIHAFIEQARPDVVPALRTMYLRQWGAMVGLKA